MNNYSATFKVLIFATQDVNIDIFLNEQSQRLFEFKNLLHIGVESYLKDIKFEDKTYHLQIWDFNLQEKKFRFLIPTYCMGASGALIFFRLSNDASFNKINEWIDMININDRNVPIVLIGIISRNKSNPKANYKKAADFARSREFDSFITSNLKSKKKKSLVFDTLTRLMIENLSKSLANEIHVELKKVEKEIGVREIEPIEEEIKKFCEIIDDNNPIYFERSIFPPGYIMNLTNRVIQEVFIKIGPKFIFKIKGVIHVSSEVKFFKVMTMTQNYMITIETSRPIEKKGKIGKYFSIVFKTSILDKENEIYALDNHEFFFKL